MTFNNPSELLLGLPFLLTPRHPIKTRVQQQGYPVTMFKALNIRNLITLDGAKTWCWRAEQTQQPLTPFTVTVPGRLGLTAAAATLEKQH
ncbi:hypothetical protein RRG08_020656 [Elysia crispata]|uniref:Uncharacterized protein n=1 Tax=Elysia crispata TaxID=231223 RepID=A0AAE0Z4E3_9GAST|nr:hypothetical protein RRG08_020656 [Elysia crispata]